MYKCSICNEYTENPALALKVDDPVERSLVLKKFGVTKVVICFVCLLRAFGVKEK